MSVLARSIMMSCSILTATVLPALAADGRAHPDNLVVWMFLGLCALIIVAQVAPLIRNARKHAKKAADETKTSEQTQMH